MPNVLTLTLSSPVLLLGDENAPSTSTEKLSGSHRPTRATPPGAPSSWVSESNDW